jgi:GNAT superfamily N-acetyltransferase
VTIGRQEPPRFEPLGNHHDRSAFSCGVDALDRYFRTQAGQDVRKHIAAPFILIAPDDAIAGYYTLSAASIAFPDLPPEITRKLPKYPSIPATLIGRLAVDRRYRGFGYGRLLLADALYRAQRSEIASFAVIVDAKDDNAGRFYQRESFLPFPDRPLTFFRPMSEIKALFE